MVLITGGEATLQINNDRVQQNLSSNANFGLQTQEDRTKITKD